MFTNNTYTALVVTIRYINDATDNGKYVCIPFITFIDMNKAFDTVNHALLFEKIHEIVIRRTAQTFIKNYFAEMNTITRINNTVSKIVLLQTGSMIAFYILII